MARKFKLTSDLDISSLASGNEKVCVVSVIGKSRYNQQDSKATRLNSYIGAEVFENDDYYKAESHEQNQQAKCEILGYYDPKLHAIFLELSSPYDTCQLLKHQNQPQAEVTEHARALLLLFSVSHVVLLVSPNPSLDVAWLNLFQVLHITRQKLLGSVSDILQELSVPKAWTSAGRPCSPRVLFVFENCPPPVLKAGQAAIKRMSHSLEDQIYRLLRKSRIITNISNNSLFAVPANEEFVHICGTGGGGAGGLGGQARNNIDLSLNLLKQHCDKAYDTDPLIPSSSFTALPPVDNSRNAFTVFLMHHIELALSQGFDDNVGRNPVPAGFELASVQTFYSVCKALYAFFTAEHHDSSLDRSQFTACRLMLNVDTRFSESRCGKVLPLAESAYQDGLPQHYTKDIHIKHLERAQKVFVQHARGPARDKYCRQLDDDCTKIWSNGRQRCEQNSVTGNACTNPLHLLPEDTPREATEHQPVMKHCSQVKNKAACNCGRKQTEREDPFTHKAANYEFYNKLSGICCDTLDRYEFPVFKPSVADAKAAEVVTPSKDPTPTPAAAIPTPGRKDSALVTAMSNLSLGLSLGQRSSVDMVAVGDLVTGDDSQENEDEEEDEEAPEGLSGEDEEEAPEEGVQEEEAPEEENPDDKVPEGRKEVGPDELACRQHSTTEYLPAMLHSQSPLGLLPQFPEWALLCTGKYSSYSPSHGMDQPGFTLSYNFLLPWDIAVKDNRWPTIAENTKKGKHRKMQQHNKDLGATLRVYIGFEYECPRGHRFFCSAPEKVFKAPASGIFKETADKVMGNDMPLYCQCNCRNPKGSHAQLMRFHVAIPDGALEVKINPRVQAGGPDSPVFYPGHDAPIPLPADSIWVLRLPYVYVGEDGACSLQKKMAGKLLQPICTVTSEKTTKDAAANV